MNLDDLRARNFVTVAQAAEFFGDCDERTVRRAIEAEQLPAVRLGTKTLIPVPPLLAFLQAPEQPAAPAPGVNPDLVAHALDLIRAGLRVLEPHLDGADVRPLNPVKDDDAAAS
ncbi:helix-turn-helix domain-containing protein [Nonomuraea wenchangensis]|uniref:helix-turn-helix domain-containing protein n=1 Tax=Nonomuraea wenchangensis TaxID=568860 RepID=UPI00384E9022